MMTRWLAPLALLALSPALAHADPPPAATTAAVPASATPAATPAKQDAPAPAKAAPAKATAAPAKKEPARAAAKKSEPAATEKTAARPRPRRIIEQREQAAAKAGREQRYDMTIAARPQQPIVNFVVEKTPVKFELPELHPGQYDVPTGLTR